MATNLVVLLIGQGFHSSSSQHAHGHFLKREILFRLEAYKTLSLSSPMILT